MTVPKSLTRFYDRLDADERFRLLSAAAARRDEDELRRLMETCPRKTYSLLDPAVSDRFADASLAAAWFTIAFLDSLRHVESAWRAREWIAGAIVGYKHGANVGWQGAGRQGAIYETVALVETVDAIDVLKGFEDETISDRERKALCELEDTYDKAVAALEGLLEGFRCFCWEAGLEPEELLAWSLVGARAIDGAAIHLDREVAPNESWAAQTVELFRDWFPTLASRGTR